jgi:hypothetical protein
MLGHRNAMKSKLNELIPHLKNMSGRQVCDSEKSKIIMHPATAAYFVKRYI